MKRVRCLIQMITFTTWFLASSNLWFDNLVIPKTAKHIKEAYAFINFMLQPENAAQNAEYIGYATPNTEARNFLPNDIKENKSFLSI